MEYNVNNSVTVTLTKKGAEILNQYNKECENIFHGYGFTENFHDNCHLYAENDTYTSELWNIMRIFGKHLYNGCDIPFVNNVVKI